MKTLAARSLVVLVIALLLAACGNSRVVKREGSRPSAPSRAAASVPRDGSYVVRAGDTLYGIAFRHGLDYREVAGWNRIPAPYTIYPGQRLRLASARTAAAPRNSSRGSVTGMPATTPLSRPGASPVASYGDGPAPVTALPPEPRPANGAAPSAVPLATPISPRPVTSTPVVVPSTPVVPAVVSAGGWRWPTQGQLIGRFAAGDPKRQGIDIAGTAGQAVVKHSDEWLSAYAHSRKRLVSEGTAVRAGQPIAELGRSGTSRDMLHFEVRRNGKPVDPLQVLPPP